MARYHLNSGGKCLRGHLALAEAEACELSHDKALPWAVACELLHNATLIHDDIQDNDPIRRGQPSLWKKYGVSQAINTGDLLIFRSFKLASQLGQSRLTDLLSQTAEILVRGQVDELLQLPKDDKGYWNSYLEMTQFKTGTLFKLPVHGIQILRGSDLSAEEAKAWYSMGCCYQIYDDIRDYLGQKQPGQKQKDFEEKRINALLAWLSKDQDQATLLDDYLALPSTSKERPILIKKLHATLEKNNVVAELLGFADKQLATFKNHTKPTTRDVVLHFFETAVQKGVHFHEPISI